MIAQFYNMPLRGRVILRRAERAPRYRLVGWGRERWRDGLATVFAEGGTSLTWFVECA